MTRLTATGSIAACFLAFGIAGAASAQQGFYAGGGLGMFQTDEADLGAVIGTVGYQFNTLMAIEGEYAVGIEDETYSVLGQTVEAGLDREIGAYLVGVLPLPVFDLFGRVGYANIEVSIDSSLGSASADESGLAYGGGLEFDLLMLRGRASYTRFEFDDDGEVDLFSLTALLQF